MQLLLSQLSSTSTGLSLTAETKTNDGKGGTKKKKKKKPKTNAERRRERREGGGEVKEEEDEEEGEEEEGGEEEAEGEVHREIKRIITDVQWGGEEEGGRKEGEEEEEEEDEEVEVLLVPGEEMKEGGREGGAGLRRRVTMMLALLEERKEENDRYVCDWVAFPPSLLPFLPYIFYALLFFSLPSFPPSLPPSLPPSFQVGRRCCLGHSCLCSLGEEKRVAAAQDEHVPRGEVEEGGTEGEGDEDQ